MAGNHRSGRRPKPKALHLVAGAAPNRQFTMGVPDVPEELQGDDLALKYWRELTKHLDAHAIMAHEYAQALATLACVCADYRRTREQFRAINFKSFHTEKRSDGRIVVVEAPILKRLNELAVTLTRLLGEFGLTPLTAVKVFGGRQADAPRKWDALSRPRNA